MTRNEQIKQIETSIERLINRLNRYLSQGDWRNVNEHKAVLNALIAKWEAVTGEPLEDNSLAYNRIMSKLDGALR